MTYLLSPVIFHIPYNQKAKQTIPRDYYERDFYIYGPSKAVTG